TTADPLAEWANSPLNFTATVGVFKDGVQIAAEDERWLVKARELYDGCSLYPEKTADGFTALLELRNHVHSILAAQPAAVDGAMVWKPINVLPASDDLFWFARGDTVDGPRPPQYGGYDAEEWDWFAPAE